MEKRLIFNEKIYAYEEVRPSYPKELYDDIFLYMNKSGKIKAIEIGIGTGQATQPFLAKGFDVTAVDIGENFVGFVRNKYSRYKNFNTLHGDFMNEEFENNSYDLIYSATAFHWLPEERYQKVMNLLKPGGIVALFWNRPFVRNPDDFSNELNAVVYDKYYGKADKTKEFSEQDIVKICAELVQSGFKNVTYKLYKRMRTLPTDDYIKLINTYSDYCLMPENLRKNFENDMRLALQKCGDKINIYDTIDLYLSKKS